LGGEKDTVRGRYILLCRPRRGEHFPLFWVRNKEKKWRLKREDGREQPRGQREEKAVIKILVSEELSYFSIIKRGLHT